MITLRRNINIDCSDLFTTLSNIYDGGLCKNILTAFGRIIMNSLARIERTNHPKLFCKKDIL